MTFGEAGGGRVRAVPGTVLRVSAGLLVAVVALLSLNASLRPGGTALVAATVAVIAAGALFPGAVLLVAAATLPLLPILGNLVQGPWVAPAELVALAVGAGILLSRSRGDRPGAGPLGPLLALAAVAAAVSGVAATAAALRSREVPGALSDLVFNLFAAEGTHAAAPLRAAAVHGCALAGWVAARRLSARWGARRVVTVLVGSAAAVGAYAIAEASLGLRLWPAERYERISDFRRVVSTLADYNSAASFLALALFPCIAIATTARGRSRGAAAAASVLVGAGLLLAGSRSAWIGTAVAGAATLVAVAWARPVAEGSRSILVAGGLLGAGVLATVALPGRTGEILRSRVSSLASPTGAAGAVTAGRVGFWVAGARMLADNPVSGVGPGRVPARFAQYRPRGFPVEAENVHAFFLQLLCESGVPGGFVLLAPFAGLALLLARAPPVLRSGGGDAAVLALAPGLLAFTLSGLAAHPWLLVEMQLVYWGAAGILEGEVATEGTRGFRLLFGVSVAVLLAWAPFRLLKAPGSERGRFGYGAWGWDEGGGERQWVGPRSLLFLSPPPGPYRITLLAPGGAGGPVAARARLGGGEWASARLEPGGESGLLLVPGTDGARAGRVPLEVVASSKFCPASLSGGDRRILALQLQRPRPSPRPDRGGPGTPSSVEKGM